MKIMKRKKLLLVEGLEKNPVILNSMAFGHAASSVVMDINPSANKAVHDNLNFSKILLHSFGNPLVHGVKGRTKFKNNRSALGGVMIFKTEHRCWLRDTGRGINNGCLG
ncbi:unnamed protein product [Citrullus colocynthis]|uniref:Uncharacterized protein n=1 Tax=Citrullus colocynthis TaxID=252529 RepID=A0ABP0XMX2_9ROSI